jgi:hypothetical protein
MLFPDGMPGEATCDATLTKVLQGTWPAAKAEPSGHQRYVFQHVLQSAVCFSHTGTDMTVVAVLQDTWPAAKVDLHGQISLSYALTLMSISSRRACWMRPQTM